MKLLYSLLIALSLPLQAQVSFEYPEGYKTFKSDSFEVGDRIITPKIAFALSPWSLQIDTNDSIRSIANFLHTHTDLKFEIACFTDSRGSVKANELLSQKRAEHIFNELTQYFKIDSFQIIAKTGYGESVPLINDDEIMKMSTEKDRETSHQINRRTELIVVSRENKKLSTMKNMKTSSCPPKLQHSGLVHRSIFGHIPQLCRLKSKKLHDKKVRVDEKQQL